MHSFEERAIMEYSPPEHYALRAVKPEDLDEALALFNACSIDWIGRPQIDAAALRTEWGAPTLNLATDTQAVFDGDRMIAYVEVWDSAPHVKLYFWGRVHPEHQGAGIGAYLVHWAEARAKKALSKAPEGTQVVLSQGVPGEAKRAHALLEAQGYDVVRHWFRMVIEMDDPPPPSEVPEGLHIRPFDRDELADVIRADQDAFRDHWGFVERPFDEELANWSQWIDTDPDFDPGLWFLGMDGDEIAGVCLCHQKVVEDPEMGWVNSLGVRRPWRRRGLALALLRHAFGVFYSRGKTRVGLGVDATSLTGATRLYEKAGMHVQRKSVTYEKMLRAGRDLTTQTLED
jgi:GNAT superfamily N-acetyltransferase